MPVRCDLRVQYGVAALCQLFLFGFFVVLANLLNLVVDVLQFTDGRTVLELASGGYNPFNWVARSYGSLADSTQY